MLPSRWAWKTLPVQQKMGLFLGPLLALLIMLFTDLDPENVRVSRTAGIAVWMATWWITNCLPLAVTALIPVVTFPLFGIMSGPNVARSYMNDIIFLFLGGFLVAISMERWNLHRRLALWILHLFGLRPRMIMLGFMTATAFLSMWISNTATAMMMLPIALALLTSLEEHETKAVMRRFGAAVMLGIAFSASIGGTATLVGTPPNLVLAEMYHRFFPEAPRLSFALWMVYAAPLALGMLLASWGYLCWWTGKGPSASSGAEEVFRRQHNEMGAPSFEERAILTVFIALVVLWLTRAEISIGDFTFRGWASYFPYPKYITDGTVAIAMGFLLFIIPVRSQPTNPAERQTFLLDRGAIQQLPWNIVILFGGGFALAYGFESSGLSVWVGERLSVLSALHPLLIVLIICIVISILTELTSNTATATIFLPVLAANAISLGVHPLFFMAPAAIACSMAFMLPVATPPNAIVFGTDKVQIGDMLKAGLFLNILKIIILPLSLWFFGKAIFGIDLEVMPEWAQK